MMPSASPPRASSETPSVTTTLPKALRSPCAASRTAPGIRSADRLERRGLGDHRRGVVVDDAQVPRILRALGPLAADQRRSPDVLGVELDRSDDGVELG